MGIWTRTRTSLPAVFDNVIQVRQDSVGNFYHCHQCSMLFSHVEGEVPGSAVLVFDIEMISLEEGLPEGYMFIWDSDITPNLFTEMDKNKDNNVEPSEVGYYF